jgi:hypothetical protein
VPCRIPLTWGVQGFFIETLDGNGRLPSPERVKRTFTRLKRSAYSQPAIQWAPAWKPEYSETIRGRSVVILPDNDPPKDENGKPHYKGQKHAASVAADLLRVGGEVRIVEVPEGKEFPIG